MYYTSMSLRVMCVQAMSPDGEAIVTGAGDETLRFWNVFSKMRSTKVLFLFLFFGEWWGGVIKYCIVLLSIMVFIICKQSYSQLPLKPTCVLPLSGVCVSPQPFHQDPVVGALRATGDER